MNKLYLFIIICLTTISGLKAQSNLSGQVLSSEDSSQVEGAHILNLSAQQQAISDQTGYFELLASIGDTLLISNVNFERKQLIIKELGKVIIKLQPKDIQLEEVLVTSMPATANAFKKQILDMDIIEDETIEIKGLMPVKPKGKIPANYDPSVSNSAAYAINKPISFITKKFNKSYKSKVKYYQLKASHGETIAFDKKFNRDLVEQLTALKSDDLTKFIIFMDIDRGFVLRSSEYEIAMHIKKQYTMYMQTVESDTLNINPSSDG